jgi:hypothetical protein
MTVPFSADLFETQSKQVVVALKNEHTHMMYRKAMEHFVQWWRRKGNLPLDRSLVQDYIDSLIDADYSECMVRRPVASEK